MSCFISHIELDEKSIIKRSPEIEMERHRAISDLLHHNSFTPIGMEDQKDIRLKLSIKERNIIITVMSSDPSKNSESLTNITVSQTAFRRTIQDYFIICENFYDMAKKGQHARMEALDMGRRSLHNDGAEILMQQLKNKVVLDQQTARQLFTLICILHIRVFTN